MTAVDAGQLRPLREWLGELPRAILMDLDGTLIDSAADIALSLNRGLDDLALPRVSELQVRDWVGRGAGRLVEVVLQHVLPHHADNPHRHEVEASLLERFMARYQDSVCEASTVYPGVREFIDAAHAAGIRLACVTNKPYKPAVALLTALDLLDDFELLIGGDTLAHKKPHPEPLLHCLRHFGVTAQQALMVGDSRNDVDAAKAAGIKVVAVPYGYNHGEPIEACAPDRLVASLAALI